MQLETITRIIQLVIAPVVMVSACAILLNGLLTRYGAINDRMRSMARERLDLLQAEQGQKLMRERLEQVDYQLPNLLHHHKLTHDAVLAVYISTAIFIADMFVIGLGAVRYADWIGVAVLVIFLGGVSALLIGVFLTAVEVRTSHQAVHYEVRRILDLKQD